MTHTDPVRERRSSLRRARLARQGLVAGAVAGSLGIAGVLGLSSAITQSAPTAQNPTAAQDNQNTAPSQRLLIQGDDDGGGEGSDDGGQLWVPVQPSQQFGGGSSAPAPHATSGGS